MCNIAGYVGEKEAAPIILNMLKKQAYYDGGYSTGIATIHEGKIYMRKVIGTVDDLIRETDALSLPGTIGIAHSRPSNNFLEFAHPFLSEDESIALVLNGTIATDYLLERRNNIANDLADKGYKLTSRQKKEIFNFPRLKTGESVACADVLVNLMSQYMKDGLSFDEAHKKADDDMFSERVTVAINKDIPDYISVCRITRPMEALLCDGESYISTTSFAFPEDAKGDIVSLPTLRVCNIEKGSLKITEHTLKESRVAPITPLTYKKAYERAVEMLTGKKDAPRIYDDFEIEFKNMPGLWPEEYNYAPYAKLAYDVLYQLHSEGRLKTTIGTQTTSCGDRDIAYMYINN